MRLHWLRRAKCCECDERAPGLMPVTATTWICAACAHYFGYDEVMLSIREMLHARQTQR